MVHLDNEKSIPGKRLLPQLAIGCLLFAGLLGVGTYLLAKATTPYFKKKNDEYLHQRQQDRNRTDAGANPF